MALPNTYYRLDYIQSSGSQYINTGITGYIAFKLKFQLVSAGSSQTGYFGSKQSGNANRFGCMNYNGVFHFMLGDNNMWNASVDTNTHELDFNSTRLIDNGTEYATPSGVSYGSSPFYLFACYNQSTKASMRIEYFQQLDGNGNITKNLIPAKRKSDNVIGLYDDVNDVFYTNAGSGSFTYGSIVYNVDVEEEPTDSGTITGTGYYPSGNTASLLANANSGYLFDYWELQDYTRLEYIESSGTQYINTGFTPSGTTRFDVGFNTSSLIGTTGFGTIFGSRENHYTRGYQLTTYSDNISTLKGHFLYGTSANTQQGLATIRHNVDIVVGSDMHIVYAENTLTSNDVVTDTISAQSFTAPSPIYIFALNGNGSATEFSNTKLQFLLIYDNNVLVRNYIPVKRNSDNEIGLLDLVEMKFYANSGTGTFTGGSELGKLTYTDNPLSLVVNSDLSLIANFKLNYQITLTYDSTLGSASYTWVSGTQIELVATPNSNAQFKGWYINSIPISTSSTYTYTVLSDVVIEARFERVWDITSNVSGNGSIQYTRGTDRNDVVFSVIADANNHFVKYVVDGVEYTTTPLTLYLTQDTTITAYFEENERYHITVNSNFPYGSFYISDNDVFAGTIVTIWARPFPDYNFVKWQDGVLENPRQIEVNADITLIAEYQRSFETNGIYQYRCYVKDQLDLTSPPKAFMVVDTFDISTDLLTNATSSITVMKMLSDIDEGDVLVLYDPMGTTLYTGVINSIEDRTINCSQMQSFYKGTWIYNVSPQDFLEHEIAVLLQDYADGKLYRSSYIDPLVAQRLGGITIDYVGTTTVNLPTDLDDEGNEQMTTYDMEEFIYELYQKYSIKFEFEINISGTNYVHIKVPSYEAIKVGNNMFAIQDMSPITEIEETNKLVIYAQDKTYRTTYIATKNSIVEAPSTTANRFNITNTEVVFSDDPVEDLVASSLPESMFNHKLTFTLIIKNFLYTFGDFNLGGELDVYYNDDYYRSVLTGYGLSKQSNQNITEVDFTCGKVRTALTKMLTLGKI